VEEKRALIDPEHPTISLARQCELVGLARSSYYYQPVPESEENLRLMRLLDEQYTRTPFYGIKKMTAWLRTQGHEVNHKRVARLLRQMGLMAIYPGPRLSQPGEQAVRYPYLLRGLNIDRVNQVWSTDITYIRLQRGFFTARLQAAGVRISWDGRGRALDNIFVERLWRSVKYEEVYLKAYQSVAEAERGLKAYFQFYNQDRLHQALAYQTPVQVYYRS
jgi:putative transposase